jgi:hypothetical protein
MAISRIKTSSVLQGFPKSRSLLAGNAAFNPSSYESIATVTVGSGGSASVTLSSIPATYTHLQIRGILRASYNLSNTSVRLTFNSDTGTNYSSHDLTGVNSSISAGNETSVAYIPFARGAYDGLTSGIFTSFVVDILDYANTNKNKTTRTLTGYTSNGEGQISFRSGLWRSTSAITSINMFSNVGDLMQYSSFALYGIKGS